jgi:DNA-binding Lrp family transcriptional regulator
MLKEKDLKLISILEKDGRTSYAQLSRSLGISTATVAKKVKNLIDDGIITINGIVNPHRLGHTAHAIIAIKTYVNKLEDVCNYLTKFPNVDLMVAVFGRFNLVVSVEFMSWDALHEFISSELAAMKDIREMEIYFTKVDKKRAFDVYPTDKNTAAVLNIDKTDREIIEALRTDGRTSVSDLAHQLGLSISSISKRISHLHEENAVRVHAVVNQNKVGFHANAFILIHAHHDQIENICQNFLDFEEIRTIITLVNGYEIFIAAICLDSEDLYELVHNKIAAITGVIDTETWLRGKVFKRYYGPLPVK